MPLDKNHVTIASRIMLPVYVLYDTLYGAMYLLDPEGRLRLTPSLAQAQDFFPIATWGGLWMGAALVMAVALAKHSREAFSIALAFNALAWILWGILLESSVFIVPNVSYLAFAPSWFVAVSSLATMASLEWREGAGG